MVINNKFVFCFAATLLLFINLSVTVVASESSSIGTDTNLADETINVANEFTVVFEQISPEQHAKISSFYTHYSGYNEHFMYSQNNDKTVVKYVTNASIDILMNNFSKTADYLGMKVLVRGNSGTISIHFVELNVNSLPYKEW